MKLIAAVLCCLFYSVSSAPESGPVFQPSPVYNPPTASDTANFVADQPVYSVPETSVSFPVAQPTVATKGATTAVGPTPIATQDVGHAYNPEGYVDPYAPYQGYDPGYGVQTGYEGYLVPTGGYYSPLATTNSINPLGYLWGLIPTARTVIGVLGRTAIVVLSGAGIILAGAAVVFGVCAFTPICTITLAGLSTRTIKEEVRSYMTPDRISAAAQFVRDAIDKYQKMQTIGKQA